MSIMKNLFYVWAISILMYLSLGSLTVSCAENHKSSDPTFPRDKWVFLTDFLYSEKDLEKGKKIALEAKEHGLNGVVLAGGLDSITSWENQRVEYLKQFKAYCDEIGIEVIPQIFSAGYGGAVLSYNPNLAAALPFIDAPFIVDGKIAKPMIQYGNILKNPGFEDISSLDKTPSGYDLLEPLGKIIFIDEQIKHSGKYSVRLENFGTNPYGHARVVQVLDLKPNREYQFSAWVKTDAITPLDSLKVMVYQTDMKRLLPSDYFAPPPKATQDWTKYTFRFKTLNHDSARLYMGTWEGKSGRVWIDDLEVVEISPARDVLKRPGTPITVKSADRIFTFEEGIDFEPIPGLSKAIPEGPMIEIHLTDNSRMKQGEKLLVSGYSASRLRQPGHYQISICMSEEEVYDFWAKQLEILYPILKMKKTFISMDEIRGGGACKACKDRHMTMGQILGDCITRQMKMIRKYDPEMEIYCWGDMLDPNANAHDNYYLVQGTFDKSWEYVPKDLIIVAWIYEKRIISLKFFSEQGFRIMGAPYYDKKSLNDTTEWYKELERTPGSIGIMYTTWKDDFSFLSEFGDYLNTQNGDSPR